jgi:hypothetical protein
MRHLLIAVGVSMMLVAAVEVLPLLFPAMLILAGVKAMKIALS